MAGWIRSSGVRKDDAFGEDVDHTRVAEPARAGTHSGWHTSRDDDTDDGYTFSAW